MEMVSMNYITILTDSVPTVYHHFAAPALRLVAACPAFRVCPELSDPAWVAIGLQRALYESPTGRGFLQTHGADLEFGPTYSHYFHTLKSARRLQLLLMSARLGASKRVYPKGWRASPVR